MRKHWLGLIGTVVVLLVAASPEAAAQISAGVDCWRAVYGKMTFGESTPIPADFFGPGSDPFSGIVVLEADRGFSMEPNGLIRRADMFVDIPIEVVQLELESIKPISVTYGGGPASLFDVFVDVDPNVASTGVMSVTGSETEGTFQITDLTLNLELSFVPVQGGGPLLLYRTMPTMSSTIFPWKNRSPCGAVPPCTDNSFYPAGWEPMGLVGGDAPEDAFAVSLVPYYAEVETLICTRNSNDVRLSWEILYDVALYDIYYTTSLDEPWTLVTDVAPPWDQTDGMNGNSYFYTVEPVCGSQ